LQENSDVASIRQIVQGDFGFECQGRVPPNIEEENMNCRCANWRQRQHSGIDIPEKPHGIADD
jgi:hypothetical protein